MRGGAVLAAGLLLLTGCIAGAPPQPADAPAPGFHDVRPAGGLRPDLAEDVRAEFLHTYLAYERLAGDHDELLPVSGGGSDFFAQGHPVALTTIEALDTLYLMGFDAELRSAVDKVANVSFDIDAPFQVLETTIRVLGGLLSGYHATGDPRLLAQAKDIGDRLLPAFERSPTGMPYRYVNLHTGEPLGNVGFVAEVGTGIAEFGDLSLLTGDPRYADAARAALKALVDRRAASGLVGTAIDVETGQWLPPFVATVHPPVDSFYESLLDGAQLLGDAELRAWHEQLTGAVVRHTAVKVRATPVGLDVLSGGEHLWFGAADLWTGASLGGVQHEMGSFYAGFLAQAGRADLGRANHDAWQAALERSGHRVLPECLDPLTLEAVCHANFLRPEFVDAAFHLWLATGDPVFVERAAQAYEAMKATSRVANGYTVLLDVAVQPEVQGDSTPAYWYAENMKYFFLLFGRPARFDYQDHLLTTEGDVLRGLLRD